jgi:ABC-2 type transport system ATP-binding protein
MPKASCFILLHLWAGVSDLELRVEYPTRERGQKSKLAVKDLALSVRAGDVFGFLGPNGAGKTTTMNVLLGLPALNRGPSRWSCFA